MGLKKLKTVEVFRKDYALSAGLTKVEIPSDQMPSGVIHRFNVRLQSAAITGFASAAADYQRVLRHITYGSQFPKHNVMSSVSGKFWDAVYTALMGKAPTRTTPTANGFAVNYYLPFAWPGTEKHPAPRPKDTALLNINNKALPFLTFLLGPFTDLDTSATACTVTVVVEAVYEPIVRAGFLRPDNPTLSGDQPLKMLELATSQKADLSTNSIIKFLTGGGREMIGVALRELDDSGAEAVQTDIFTLGVATPSKLVFVRGDADAYSADRKIVVLDSVIEDEFGIAPQTGHHYWLAAADGKLSGTIDIRDGAPMKAETDNLATTASRILEHMQLGTIDIPKAVLDIHAQQLGAGAA